MLHRAVTATGISEHAAVQQVEILVQAGAEVNAVNIDGETALTLTGGVGYPEVAKFLIAYGADPTICNKTGFNALCYSIRRNCHSIIDLLLCEHQDHTQNIHQIGTLTHLAANFADTESLQLLTRGNLQRRDINIKNKEGLTPVQVALRRKNIDVEWRHAFFDFLRSIDKDQPLPGVTEEARGSPRVSLLRLVLSSCPTAVRMANQTTTLRTPLKTRHGRKAELSPKWPSPKSSDVALCMKIVQLTARLSFLLPRS